MCGFDIYLGESIRNHLKQSKLIDFNNIFTHYMNRRYFLGVDLKKRIIYISFENKISSQDILEGYFHATCLAIAICIYNGLELVKIMIILPIIY